MEDFVLKTVSTPDGRLRGLYIGIRGRSNLFIATTRGFLHRMNFPYMCDGRFYSTHFCLRRKVVGINTYVARFQKEESVGLHFKSVLGFGGKYRFLGSIWYSGHGLVSCTIDGLNKDIYPKRNASDRSDSEGERVSNSEVENGYYDSGKKRSYVDKD